MDPLTIGVLGLIALLFLLALRVPIAFSLAFLAFVCIFSVFALRFGSLDVLRILKPTLTLTYSTYFDLIHSYDFSMIPLFILLGHVASKTGITSDIYLAARLALARLPGGVAMASVLGCGGFAAMNGSSLACAAAMGRVCSVEMLDMGYNRKLATASVAMGGTIGSMIPPSIGFILFAIFTETSISKLFLAGILPGLLTILGYLIVIYIWVVRHPASAPVPDFDELEEPIWKILLRTWPAVSLFAIIVGGIYGGIFTATESAGASVLFAVLVSFARGRLPMSDLMWSLRLAASQSAALFFVAGAAKMFVSFIALAGVAPAFVELVSPETLGPMEFILGVVIVYLILGTFLDPLGIMVLTLPFMVPVVEQMGMDLIWFGVIIVKLIEIGLVTPPLGLNVFVLKSVVGRDIRVEEIFSGCVPFLLMDLIVLTLLIAYPIISLVIPNAL